MRESTAARHRRAAELIARLKLNYPDAACALEFTTPFELLIATILSAQCTDARVNVVTRTLFARYPSPATLAAADAAELEDALKTLNFYRNKAKSLRAMAQSLLDRHAGEVPRDLDHLVALAGVGRKTANVVMGNAFAFATGVVVDTHVARLAYRLGFTRSEDPVRIERDLQKIVPTPDWILFSHLLIFHGRAVCKARRPACERCPIEAECPKRRVAKIVAR